MGQRIHVSQERLNELTAQVQAVRERRQARAQKVLDDNELYKEQLAKATPFQGGARKIGGNTGLVRWLSGNDL